MRVLACSGQWRSKLPQPLSVTFKVFWLAFVMSGAMVVSPPAEAMKFYNNSAESVFVLVDGPGPENRQLVQSGKTWVLKPGNLPGKLDLEPQQEYSYWVWTSEAENEKVDWQTLDKFEKSLRKKFGVTRDWAYTRDNYRGTLSWPKGLLMIARGFDDDDFWLKYYGLGRTPIAEKGGCFCEGKDSVRSGLGCKGLDFKRKGNNRSEHPDLACKSPTFWKRAKYMGSYWCPKGSFFDPRKGGECWSCPAGTKRSLHGVTSAKACFAKGKTSYKKAVKKRNNSRIGQGCPKGQFWDVKGGRGLLGACYSCSKGYRRTAKAVTSSKSCQKGPKTFEKATFQRKKACKAEWPGSFFDPRKGGQCWLCGSGYSRNLNPVTSAHACELYQTSLSKHKASTPFTVRFPPEVHSRGIGNLPPPVNPDPEPPTLPAPYPNN
ncbi:MAG: hypothetical protein AB7T38_13435 [Nitrospirales bacterium]